MGVYTHLFKTNYFPKESGESLRAKMLLLLIYIPGLAIFFDLFESYMHHDTLMFRIEASILAFLFMFSFLFPRILSLANSSYIILGTYTIFLFIALYVPDQNSELTLFWFAALPIGIFFFLGIKDGLKWTIAITLLFISSLILSVWGIYKPIYSNSLLFQLLFGYLAVSYMLYVIEKERDLSESNLKDSLAQNKLLFKEVHHRTKNNMQVMMGLLETQSFKIEDPKCQKMLHAHIDRIKAMSYVHENLYKGTSIEEVDMHKYLGEILDNLQKITQHTIITDIDYITMDIKHSISVGLLVNEAVSNAIEHAYSVGGERIDVSLKSYGERYELSIKDYGLGFNKNKTFNSLGMILIEDLSTSLPHGELHIDTEHGTHIQVYFDGKEE